jgi:hypothetical protein
LYQIREIKPFPATAPYYTEEKVNYKVSKENFNYKKMVIEKVLQNINGQSSLIIFYNTFRTLEAFVFILGRGEHKMYQDLVFSKVLEAKGKKGLTEVSNDQEKTRNNSIRAANCYY